MRTLKILADTHRYWYECNKIADLHWQEYKYFFGEENSKSLFYDSEIKIEGTELGRGLPEYEKLSQLLKQGSFDSDKFLPTVPSPLKDKFNKVEFIEHIGGETMLLFPWYLSRWLGSKNVLDVVSSEKVEIIDTFGENYFKHIPYDSFVLTVDRGFVTRKYVDSDGNEVCLRSSNIIVIRRNNVVKLFTIPDEVPSYLFSKKILDKIDHILISIKNKKRTDFIVNLSLSLLEEIQKNECLKNYFYVMSFDQYTGEWFALDSEELVFTKINAIEYFCENRDIIFHSEMLDILEKEWSFEVIPFFLNGLGKIFATYDPKDVKNLIDSYLEKEPINRQDLGRKKSLHKNQKQQLEWFEVEPRKTTQIIIPERPEVKKGGTKCAHPRSPTVRRYKDGKNTFVTASGVHCELTIEEKNRLNARWLKDHPDLAKIIK